MTLPPSLQDLESDTSSAPELCRITLQAGGLRLDVGLPAHLPLSVVMTDIIDIANAQLRQQRQQSDIVFDNTVDRWTLGKLGAPAIDPAKSLAEADVYDGDVLLLQEHGAAAAPLLFDDVESTSQPKDNSKPLGVLAPFGLAVFAALLAVINLHRQVYVAPTAGVTVGSGLLLLLAAVLAARNNRRSVTVVGMAVIAIPMVFAGSLYLIPNGFGAMSLPLAFALAALISLLVLQVSRAGRTFHSLIITVCVMGGTASLANVLLHPPARTLGALLATASVLMVYLSPRITIMLSKLPIPRVPTAGEPLDEIETQGGTTVEGVNAIGKQIIPTEEGLIIRVNRATEYLTGIMQAAAVSAIIGTYLAVDVSRGFFWQGTVFAFAVAAVLCLRGRSHHSLMQSATLIGAGLLIALSTLMKIAFYVPGQEVYALFGLGLLAALCVACGVVAPLLEFSPVLRRWVEILEYVAIGLVIPLCFWIIRVYAATREMRL